MYYYDEQLKELKRQVLREEELKSALWLLYDRCEEVADKVEKFDASRLKEQKDVDKFEGRTFSSFIYAVAGKKEERLDKEKQEAYAAQMKYEAAFKELKALEEDVSRKEAELESLKDCKERYDEMLAEKLEMIKKSGCSHATSVINLQEDIFYIENQMREIEEAVKEGKVAYNIADNVISKLNSAGNWSTFDMIGGGIVTDMMKYSNINQAQSMVEELQIQLGKFRTELADVKIDSDINVSIDGFARFLDYFCDNIFSDWIVKDRINSSINQVIGTKEQINEVLETLDALFDYWNSEKNVKTEELDALVIRLKV